MSTRERTSQHAWFTTKRDELLQKIDQSNDPNMTSKLESLRDLYNCLIEADGTFSDNLISQFEQIEAKLILFPTAEDMVIGHRKIIQIIQEIKSEVEVNMNVKITSIMEMLSLVEVKLASIESHHKLLISGQNEIIVTHEREHRTINAKLDELILTCQTLPMELNKQALTIQDACNRIDATNTKITHIEDNIKALSKND